MSHGIFATCDLHTHPHFFIWVISLEYCGAELHYGGLSINEYFHNNYIKQWYIIKAPYTDTYM